MSGSKRQHFKNWIVSNGLSDSPVLPLTHITIGKYARDIILDGVIVPRYCNVHERELVYCFYGRAAYRLNKDSPINVEGQTPVCLVFDGQLLSHADDVFPFDTGAFESSMYKDYLGNEFNREDFSLNGDSRLPNTLIEKVYSDVRAYVEAESDSLVSPDEVSNRGDFEVQAYLHMLNAKGANGPDDRVGSFEVVFSEQVNLNDHLECLIAPNTLIHGPLAAGWISELPDTTEVYPYEFKTKRKAEFYHAHIEREFIRFCENRGYLNNS